VPKSSFSPLAPVEAFQVVEAVLAIDPLGNDSCPYCALPIRRQLDRDLLSTDSIGTVVDRHQLAPHTEATEYAKICGAVERHRRLHVIKVFESLQDAEANIPDPQSPTIRFIDWAVREYIQTYKTCNEPRDALASLGGLVKALGTRAAIRGEIANDKNKLAKTIETEAILSDATKRKLLETEARRLGLRLIEPKAIEAKSIPPSTD